MFFYLYISASTQILNTTVGAGFTSANVVNFGEQTFPNGKSLSWADYWYRIVVEEDLPIVEYLMQVCRRMWSIMKLYGKLKPG